jgi:AraC-type transcriptional regulator N-terminus
VRAQPVDATPSDRDHLFLRGGVHETRKTVWSFFGAEDLDMPMVREVLSRDDIPEGPPSAHRQDLVVGETTVGLLRAAMRMLELLDTPEDIPFLSPLAHREILYNILRTPQAGRLRAIATSGDLVQRTGRAISWLRENYAKPLHMEALASTARMGVSTLHHQFRSPG